MYKIVAIWSAPKAHEVAAFEEYYLNVHVPKARKVPFLKRLVLTRTDGGLEGAAPACYRVAELSFDSPEQLHRSSESSAWAEMRADARVLIERFGVSLSVGMGWSNELPPLG